LIKCRDFWHDPIFHFLSILFCYHSLVVFFISSIIHFHYFLLSSNSFTVENVNYHLHHQFSTNSNHLY
jgi:hypothetical protein